MNKIKVIFDKDKMEIDKKDVELIWKKYGEGKIERGEIAIRLFPSKRLFIKIGKDKDIYYHFSDGKFVVDTEIEIP